MLKAAVFSIVLVTAVSAAAPAYADTVSVGDVVKFSPGPAPQAAGGGGPFRITAPTDSWVTFCLEFTEYMNYGGNFYVGAISRDQARTAHAQDQLMIQTRTSRDVPEPASLLLLGSTLTAFAIRRRRVAQQ